MIDEMKEMSMRDFFPGYPGLKDELRRRGLEFQPKEILYPIQLSIISYDLEGFVRDQELIKRGRKKEIIDLFLKERFFKDPEKTRWMKNKRYNWVKIHIDPFLPGLMHEIRFFFLKYKGIKIDEKEIIGRISKIGDP